jgi:ubiquitin-protein ligase
MKPLHVTTCPSFAHHVFLKESSSNKGTRNKKWMRRVAIEFRDMSTSLPLSENGGIFLRWSENNTSLMKVMIIPGADTPYGCGCFVFDVFIPNEYPNVPPMVKIITTGGGSHRFNPNLYANGKVCLSLLGTWRGEPWIPNVSTLYQVFVSIYGLIFVDEPYFNEPGFQNSRGTPTGDANNAQYNAQQRYKTVELAMVNPLKKKTIYPNFQTVIQRHFQLRSPFILQMIRNEWLPLNEKQTGPCQKIEKQLTTLSSLIS